MILRLAVIGGGLAFAGCSDPESKVPDHADVARPEWRMGDESLDRLVEQSKGPIAKENVEEVWAEYLRAREERLARRSELALSEEDLALLRELEELKALDEPAVATVGSAEVPTSEKFTFGFETREQQLWFHSGTDPQLYTVRSKDGTVLAAEIDDERLERDYPALHEIVHEGIDLIGIGY